MKTKLFFTVLFALLMVQFAAAQIPQTMSYQGVLTDADGNPVADGPVSLTFKLYDAPEGGEALWEENQQVEVANGIFNVILGSGNPLNLPFDAPYWLGITVDGEEEMAPRIALTASPYSLNAVSTLVEPEPGQGLTIRNESGEPTHQFSAEGDVTHSGTGTFLNGIVAGDSVIDTTGASLLTTGLKSENSSASNAALEQIGVFGRGQDAGVFGYSEAENGVGVQGENPNGRGVIGVSEAKQGVIGYSEAENTGGVVGENPNGAGVFGRSESNDAGGVHGENANGPGVFGYSENGGGVVGGGPEAGLHASGSKLKVDDVPEAPNQERFLVWDSDSLVKYRTLSELGGETAWQIDADGNIVASGRDVFIQDAQGNTTTRFNADGTSLHTGDETFEGDVILKGERGKGIKLVDENGETLAGFGRIDLDTGQRLGVFAKAEQSGDLAAAFEGVVEVVGEVFASSLHVVNDEGDTLTSFNADGTSFHSGEETFAGNVKLSGEAKLVFPDGSEQTTAAPGSAFDGTLQGTDLIIKDVDGNIVGRLNADGTSLHTGLETFQGGIEIAGGPGLILKDNVGEVAITLGGELPGTIHASGEIISGNSISIDGVNHIIDSDQPLDIQVSAQRALRLEPQTDSPNLIAGFSGNSVTASVAGAAIGGGGMSGVVNLITDNYGTIGGGIGNQAGDNAGGVDDAEFATVGGGRENKATAMFATVAGGEFNTSSKESATIGGGDNNTADGFSATIGGGDSNTANGDAATISGGSNNEADGFWAFIGGGQSNSATAEHATVGGGMGNTASGSQSSVGGGEDNQALGPHNTIGGGLENQTSGQFSVVAGGNGNEATAQFNATIGGGSGNTAGGNWASIGGGVGNTASAVLATVGGGQSNTAEGDRATIGGGLNNTASGLRATVPGGEDNLADGDYSFAAGTGARANHQGSILFADSNTGFDFNSVANDEFAARATGGVRLVTAIDGSGNPTAGVRLASGGSSWLTLSDRNAKTHFAAVDGREILQRLSTLSIETWSYKTQGADIRHIGPMAQEFHAAFGVGEDERHINTVDADGVALAAIQGLNSIVEEQRAEITRLKKQVVSQEKTIEELNQRLQRLEALVFENGK